MCTLLNFFLIKDIYQAKCHLFDSAYLPTSARIRILLRTIRRDGKLVSLLDYIYNLTQ